MPKKRSAVGLRILPGLPVAVLNGLYPRLNHEEKPPTAVHLTAPRQGRPAAGLPPSLGSEGRRKAPAGGKRTALGGQPRGRPGVRRRAPGLSARGEEMSPGTLGLRHRAEPSAPCGVRRRRPPRRVSAPLGIRPDLRRGSGPGQQPMMLWIDNFVSWDFSTSRTSSL